MSIWYRVKGKEADETHGLQWSSMKVSKSSPRRRGPSFIRGVAPEDDDGQEIEVGNVDALSPAAEDWREAKSSRAVRFEVLCLFTMLFTSFAYPIALIYYGLDHAGIRRLMVSIDIVVSLVLMLDFMLESRRSNLPVRKGSTGAAHALARLKLRFLSMLTLGTVVPWGTVMVLGGGSNTAQVAGFLMVFCNLPQVYGRYGTSFEAEIKLHFPRPPSQLLRLFWIAFTVVLIQNVFGGLYYYLGVVTADRGFLSWVVKDALQERGSADPISPEALAYARSVFMVYQTLLTIGYGDISPEQTEERLFATLLCFTGTFVMANMIANMSSYLGHLEAISVKHRNNVEVVERVVTDLRASPESRARVREGLKRNWKEHKGFTRSALFEDLPRTLVERIIDSQVSKLAMVPLFRQAGGAHGVFRPAASFALEHFECARIPAGTRLKPSWAAANVQEDSKCVLMILLRGTAQKVIALKSLREDRTGVSMIVKSVGGALKRISFTSMSRASQSRLRLVAPSSGVPGRSTSAVSVVSAVSSVVSSVSGDHDGAAGPPSPTAHAAPRRVATVGSLPTSSPGGAPNPSPSPSARAGRSAGSLLRGSSANKVTPSPRAISEELALGAEGADKNADSRLESLPVEAARSGLATHSGSQSSEGEGGVKSPAVLAHQALYPLVLSPGECLNAPAFFNATTMPAAPYVAVTPCDVMFVPALALRRHSLAFPEWGLGHVLDALDAGSNCRGLDPRVDAQIDTEMGRVSAEDKKARRGEIANLNRINKFKREEKQFSASNSDFFSIVPGSTVDILWDVAATACIAYNMVLIPMRLGAPAAMLPTTAALAAVDICTDLVVLLHRVLKPRLLSKTSGSLVNARGARVSQVSISGADVMLARQAAGKQRQQQLAAAGAGAAGPELDPYVISKVISAENSLKLQRLWQSRKATAAMLGELVLFVLSIAALATFLADKAESAQHRGVVLLRTPLLLRTFLFFGMVDVIKRALARRRARLANSARASKDAGASAPGSPGSPGAAAASPKIKGSSSMAQAHAQAHDIETSLLSLKIIFAFMIMAHWMACYTMTFMQIQHNFSEQYLLGIYFALTTMATVGYGDITPRNSVDSIVISYMAIAGVICYVMFISFLGTWLNDTTPTEHSVNHHRECLTAFMLDREISPGLQSEVWDFLDFLELSDTIEMGRVLGLYRETMSRSISREQLRARYMESLAMADAENKQYLLALQPASPQHQHGKQGQEQHQELEQQQQQEQLSSPSSELKQASGPGASSAGAANDRASGQSSPVATSQQIATLSLLEKQRARAEMTAVFRARSRLGAHWRLTMADKIREPVGPDRIYAYTARDSDYLGAHERVLLIQETVGPALSSSKLLRDVSARYITELAALIQLEYVCINDVLASPDYCRAELYLLRRGEVQERTVGSTTPITKVLEGSCFNERALFLVVEGGSDGAAPEFPMPANAWVATQFSEVWVLERRAFQQVGELLPHDHYTVLQNYQQHFARVVAKTNVTENLRKGGKLAKVAGGDEVIAKPKKRKVYDLDSRVQVAWSNIMFLALLWNMIVWPVRFSFSVRTLDVSPADFLADWLLDLLYIVDVVLRMRVFEFETWSGQKVNDPGQIAGAYLISSVGLCDVAAALPVDIVALLVMAASGSGFSQTPVRLMCLLRINKLLRGRRFMMHVKALGSLIKNQTRKNVVTIVKLVLVLLLAGHWSGSIFYYLAQVSLARGDPSWADGVGSRAGLLAYRVCEATTANGGVGSSEAAAAAAAAASAAAACSHGVDFIDSSVAWTEHYVTSLYFAVTTLAAVGYGDITPQSFIEVGYTCVIFVLGGLLYSLIISSLQDIVAQSDLASILYQRKSDELTAYVAMRNVPALLRSKIKEYTLKLWVQQKAVANETILSFVSTSLRDKLLLEMFGDSCMKKAAVIGPSGIWRHLLRHVELLNVLTNETLFEEGQEAKYLFFVASGQVELMSSDRVTVYSTVGAGNTLGQDGFYRIGINATESGYQSTARTSKPSLLGRLSQESLVEFLRWNPHLHERFLSEHAKFCERPSVLDLTRKNLDNQKLTKMLTSVKGEDLIKTHGLDRYIIYPGSVEYTALHAVLFALALYNVLSIPLVIGLYSPHLGPLQRSSYASLGPALLAVNAVVDALLWLGVAATVTVVSRVNDGVLLRKSELIRAAYVRSVQGWIDMLCLLPVDLVFLAGQPSSDPEGARGLFDAALLRLPRLFALYQLTRYWSILDTAVDASPKVNVKSGVRHLVMIVVWVVIMSHYLATGRMTLVAWTRDEMERPDGSFLQRYVDNIYFVGYSMTTVGYGNIAVISSYEKLFANMCMICGCFLCDAGIVATFVSIINIEDSNISSSDGLREAALTVVERQRLNPAIAEYIADFYEFKSRNNGLLDHLIVPQLSPSLATNLIGFVIHRAMGRPPELCAQLSYFSDGMIATMIADAKPVINIVDDVLFRAGDQADRLIFVIRGSVRVFLDCSKALHRSTSVNGKPVSPPSHSPSGKGASVVGDGDGNGGAIASPGAGGNPLGGWEVRLLDQAVTDGTHRCVQLRNAGLLLTNREFGGRVKETIVCASICESLVIDFDAFSRILRLQPQVGGVFKTLKEMIANPQACKCFREFLEAEHAGENLEFLLAVASFRANAKNEQNRIKKATEIVGKFVAVEAEKMINIPADIRSAILETYKEGPATLFDEAYGVIMKNTEMDSLQRFMKHPSFKELVIDIHQQRRDKHSASP